MGTGRLISIIILLSLTIFQACKDDKRYHDESGQYPLASPASFEAEILAYQQEMNTLFVNPETSPLPDRHRADFKGLDFFKPDSSYRVKATLQRTPEASPFGMPTTTKRVAMERVYGIISFRLAGKEHRLELYESTEDEHREFLFLPFLDKTNGEETYAGGRYLEVPIPWGDTLIIDFNRAYNPYCVYNPKYSCPIVPGVNTLDVAIKAGIKDFKKESPTD